MGEAGLKLSFSIRELSKALFCIGVFTKQFYILPSGSFQLGDLFFMLSFLSCIGLGKVRIAKIDFWFMAFVLLACIINMAAFISDGFYGNGLTVSMFYVYNLLAVIAFRNSFRSLDDLLSLSKVMLVSMLTQLVLYLGGGGAGIQAAATWERSTIQTNMVSLCLAQSSLLGSFTSLQDSNFASCA